MKKQDLAKKFAEIILQYLRSKKGRLTRISDMCSINRREFTTEGLSRMRTYRLLIILYAMELELYCDEYEQMIKDLCDTFENFVNQFDAMLLTE